MTARRTFEELRALHGDEIAMLIAECEEGLAGEAVFAARIRHRNERIARDPRLPRPGFYRHQDGSAIRIRTPTTRGICRCIATACPFVETSRCRSGSAARTGP